MTPPEARRPRQPPCREADADRPGAAADTPRPHIGPRHRLIAAASRSHIESDRPRAGARGGETAGPVRRPGAPATPIPAQGHITPPRTAAVARGAPGPGAAGAGRAACPTERSPTPPRRRTGPDRDRVPAAAPTRRDRGRTDRPPGRGATPDAPETGSRVPPPGSHGDAAPPVPG